LTAGCASTAPKAQFAREVVADARISSPDAAQIKVDAAADVKILPRDEDRLSQKIKLRIDNRKLLNARERASQTYEVDLHLLRYEKGNAFARAMFAGLGQIHIDGNVQIYQMPEHVLVGEFALKKTFAWGGIYGAATSMDTIEDTFSDGVAAAVTGQKEEPPKQKS
jgi:hypothetical protein